MEALNRLIDYVHDDEARSFEEIDTENMTNEEAIKECRNHIFTDIRLVDDWLQAHRAGQEFETLYRELFGTMKDAKQFIENFDTIAEAVEALKINLATK